MVWAWGANQYGQLGDGSIGADRSQPAPVPGLPPVAAIAGGVYAATAVTTDGGVWAWGLEDIVFTGDDPSLCGQLGSPPDLSDGVVIPTPEDFGLIDGQPAQTLVWPTPRHVPGLPTITAIAANGAPLRNWSNLALDTSGNIWQWGETLNHLLDLSAPPGAFCSQTPSILSGLTGITAIGLGRDSGYAIQGPPTL